MTHRILFLLTLLSLALPVAAEMKPREGWAVHRTELSHADLVKATRAAIKERGLIVVTQAGPTKAAKARGIEIPGNTVIGAFNNDFAVRLLSVSTPAMIEAPIRFYVTENANGTATLSYKRPTFILAPYSEPGVAEIATELDTIFAEIADLVISP
jgi:uncharacterized protein (DUF302 family)